MLESDWDLEEISDFGAFGQADQQAPTWQQGMGLVSQGLQDVLSLVATGAAIEQQQTGQTSPELNQLNQMVSQLQQQRQAGASASQTAQLEQQLAAQAAMYQEQLAQKEEPAWYKSPAAMVGAVALGLAAVAGIVVAAVRS